MSKIRRFGGADLSAVCTIQSKCAQTSQWYEEDYLKLAGSLGGLVLVAEADGGTLREVVGYAAFRRVLDEAELLNLAVDPTHRGCGIARRLVHEGIREMREAGAHRMYLEVRASNHPARKLYASLGFIIGSTRKSYYQDPEEDAVLMSRDMASG